MTERHFWIDLRKRLKPFGTLIRLENRVHPGTPDLLYCLRGVTGLVELKYLPTWPNQLLKHHALTREQVIFLKTWERAGGIANLLLSIAGTEFIFDPTDTARMYHEGIPVSIIRQIEPGIRVGGIMRPKNTYQLVAALIGVTPNL